MKILGKGPIDTQEYFDLYKKLTMGEVYDGE